MFDLLIAGGWVMVPIILCSIFAVTIIIERSWSLYSYRVCPRNLIDNVLHRMKNDNLSEKFMTHTKNNSILGYALVNLLQSSQNSQCHMKDLVQDNIDYVVHELEKHLTSLGTIANIAPLLGLLGTVLGMMNVFTVINQHHIGNTSELALGISQALITTAAGLMVGIFSLVFYRYFNRKIDENVQKLSKKLYEFATNIC